MHQDYDEKSSLCFNKVQWKRRISQTEVIIYCIKTFAVDLLMSSFFVVEEKDSDCSRAA